MTRKKRAIWRFQNHLSISELELRLQQPFCTHARNTPVLPSILQFWFALIIQLIESRLGAIIMYANLPCGVVMKTLNTESLPCLFPSWEAKAMASSIFLVYRGPKWSEYEVKVSAWLSQSNLGGGGGGCLGGPGVSNASLQIIFLGIR